MPDWAASQITRYAAGPVGAVRECENRPVAVTRSKEKADETNHRSYESVAPTWSRAVRC